VKRVGKKGGLPGKGRGVTAEKHFNKTLEKAAEISKGGRSVEEKIDPLKAN